MKKQQIGVVGMAVMGKNLALNIASRGYSVALYNRTAAKTQAVVAENPQADLLATYSIEAFVTSLARPRRIILMVQAGKGTDAIIQTLLPHLDQGDVLIDGGNTFFKDTIRRCKDLKKAGIHLIGAGISGGEEGALKGPSIMPGGSKEAYELVEPILSAIAAKAKDGTPCVSYMGEDGAGHYVKMVHNGIEYGDMQLIAEAYDVLRRGLGLPVETIATVFEEWNKGELDSYLIEITQAILAQVDPSTQKPMIDVIVDQAGNKGTGRWTSQSALDLGVSLPLITEAVFARFLSAHKATRMAASQVLDQGKSLGRALKLQDQATVIEEIRQGLYFAKIMSYAQGFAQLREAAKAYGWTLPYGEIAKIFRAGCIIRAQFLQKITDAYDQNTDLSNLLLDDYFSTMTNQYHQSARQVVSRAVLAGIPVPTFASAVAYFDGMRSPVVPANLIQAQRDYFGAHTYERVDRPGRYHFDWQKGQEKPVID